MSKSGRLIKGSDNKTEKSVIGNYRLEKTIGEGTFGKVKLGIHIPTEERVAIKILEKEKIQDKEDLDRITREINFLKKLKHQNIIKIFEIVENSKNFYIIMEYASGGELFNYIVKKRRLDENEASLFFVQIINGLEFIHKNNIVHRDLKPENLLLTENNMLKIIDFGLSNQYKVGQLLQTPCGSPCYAAPEMILGRKYSGMFVDTWSTGIILYAMVCGYLPFEDKNNDKLYKKILECKLEFPEYVSGVCKDLIRKILTVNPTKRIKLDEIKTHPFLRYGNSSFKTDEVSNSSSNTERNKMSDTIIEKMIDLGFDKNDVMSNIENNKHNNITTTYDLLLNKLRISEHTLNSVKKTIPIPIPIPSSDKKEKPNNINININYMTKIGNINININEKKEDELNSSSYKKTKPMILEALGIVSPPSPRKIKMISDSSVNYENANGNNISLLNTSIGKSKEKQNINVSTPSTNKNKLNNSSLTKSENNNYYNCKTSCSSKSNREIFLNAQNKEKDVNNSITLDLTSYIKNKKADGNNLILPTNNVLTPIPRLTNKLQPKSFNINLAALGPTYVSSRRGTGGYSGFNRRINTSITLDKSVDTSYSFRADGNSGGSNNNVINFNSHTISSKIVPSNTIDLMNSYIDPRSKGYSKTTHKNSYSLNTSENNNFYKRSLSLATEESRNKSEIRSSLHKDNIDTSVTAMSGHATIKKFSARQANVSQNLKNTEENLKTPTTPFHISSTSKKETNIKNIISDFKKRIKNLSINEPKTEAQSLYHNYLSSETGCKISNKSPKNTNSFSNRYTSGTKFQNFVPSQTVKPAINIQAFTMNITQESMNATTPTEGNIPKSNTSSNTTNSKNSAKSFQKKIPNSTRHKKYTTFKTFQSDEKCELKDVANFNNFKKATDLNLVLRGHVIDLTNYETNNPTTQRIKSKSPGNDFTYKQQFKKKDTINIKNIPSASNTPNIQSTNITLKNIASTKNPNTKMSKSSSNNNYHSEAKHDSNSKIAGVLCNSIKRKSPQTKVIMKKDTFSHSDSHKEINNCPKDHTINSFHSPKNTDKESLNNIDNNSSNNNNKYPNKVNYFKSDSLKFTKKNSRSILKSNKDKGKEKEKERDLIVNLSKSKNQVTDFAVCTVSNEAAIKNKLKDYCSVNVFELKEINSNKFQCSKEGSTVIIEMTKLGTNKVMKLHHLSGCETITKQIIKNIIVNIGF